MKLTCEERLTQIEKILADELSLAQISKAADLSPSNTWFYVDSLHAEHRIYISKWRVDRFSTVKLFKAGSELDAPKPSRIAPGKGEEARRAIKKTWKSDARRDWLVAAMFGVVA